MGAHSPTVAGAVLELLFALRAQRTNFPFHPTLRESIGHLLLKQGVEIYAKASVMSRFRVFS